MPIYSEYIYILVVLGDCVQKRVAFRLQIDRRHPLNGVLEAHFVVDHLGLDAKGYKICLETRLCECVFEKTLLFIEQRRKTKKIDRQAGEIRYT